MACPCSVERYHFPIVPAERVKKSCNGRTRVSPRLISIVSVPSFNGGGGIVRGSKLQIANCKCKMAEVYDNIKVKQFDFREVGRRLEKLFDLRVFPF